MSIDYCLRVIRVENIQWKHPLHSKIPDLYVDVELHGVCRKTRTIKNSRTPFWDELLVFSSSDRHATFAIRVRHDAVLLSDPNVGFVDVSLEELLERSANGEGNVQSHLCLRVLTNEGRVVHVELRGSSQVNPTKFRGILVLHLEVIDSMESAEIQLVGTREDAVSRTTEVAQSNTQGELYQSINFLLSRLKILETVTAISEIHPCIALVWRISLELLKTVTHDDEKIINLVRNVANTFDFVTRLREFSDEAAGLQVQEPIEGLLRQVVECCIFVKHHAERGFLGRTRNTQISHKIREFEQAISNFKEQIDSGLTLYSARAAYRESQRNNDTFLRQRLNPSHMDAFDRPLCLPGSRPEVMQRILEWVFSDTMQNIFWLHGIAGCGKSAISTTIADHLRDMTRLGAFLFFERGKSKPSSVIRTIAYKLSLFDSSIGSSILAQIEHDKDIASATALRQFNKLLLEPLCAVQQARSSTGPIVVVIDALDECGTPETRRNLMELLRREFPKLPNAFRFLITSRREPDIYEVFSSQQETIYAMELTRESTIVVDQESSSDTEHYEAHSDQDAELNPSQDAPNNHPLCSPEIDQHLSRLIDAPMKDFDQLNDATLEDLVDRVQLAMDRTTSRNAHQFDRFLKSAAENRGILPSNIFLSGVHRVGSSSVHGGGFADVWKGEYEGRPVALKILRIYLFPDKEKVQREIGREALVWRRLNHPNVLSFLGIFRDESEPPQLALVSDWMEKGSLDGYLSENPSTERSMLALGVACGLGYLHGLTPQVIHGDLRAANILVDSNDQPRITDFGLARAIDSRGVTAATSFNGRGSARWQAPELLYPSRFGKDSTRPTSKSDVYAFSCVCFEIFSGKIPFADLNDGAVVTEVAVNDKRPEWPEQNRGLSDNMWGLMQRCWETQPVDRPDMSVVVATLEAADLHKKLAMQDYTSSS
ncbi:hypothetical protein ACEPAH_9371 [Sanghuangporus vaninii]